VRNPRDYGFGDAPKVQGPPIVGDRVPDARCSHCGCATVYAIEVEVANPPPMLRRPADFGDMIEIRPRRYCTVAFVSWHDASLDNPK
jgi:hypothetical protein